MNIHQIQKKLNKVKQLPKQFKSFKPYLTLPNVIILTGILSTFAYLFSYLVPFTDNAFVINNIRPVAAQVNGFITELYVHNGEYVTKGQKLFSVFKKPYEFKVEQLQADYEAGIANHQALQATFARDFKIAEHRQNIWIKLSQDDEKYLKGYQNKSISLIKLQNSKQNTKAAKDEWLAAKKQLNIDKHKIRVQKKKNDAIQAQLKAALLNLELTDVIAQENGIIQNLFFSIGAPITRNQPLFSLVDNENFYIQANFNETDLRHVRQGSRAYIFPRMYLGQKVFHGVVDSNYWSANRQKIDSRTQLQHVINENQWILLPQRLPVMIKIIDPDPDYPLRVGSSAYVYIKN